MIFYEGVLKTRSKLAAIKRQEILNNEKFSQLKQNFASGHLLDQYEFFVPFPKVYITKALDSFLKLYDINPFKKFSLVEFERLDDSYKLLLETKLINSFKTSITFSELKGVTKVKIINQYDPSNFIDASTYVATQKLGHTVFETIQKFLPK